MLCTDNCWFVASVVRSTEVKKLEGGPSHLSKLILRTFFRNDGGDLKTGIILHVHGRDHPLIIFGVSSIVCGDLDALFKFLCSKGQNVTVPCPMCTNIVSVKCGWAGSDVLRAFTCLNYDEIKPHTDATIRALVRGLRDDAADVDAGRMCEAEFEELQTRRGWNHSLTTYSLTSWFALILCRRFISIGSTRIYKQGFLITSSVWPGNSSNRFGRQ